MRVLGVVRDEVAVFGTVWTREEVIYGQLMVAVASRS